MTLISADHICVRYGSDEVLHDVTLSVAPGETFQLQFTFTKGANNGLLPADVFVNEFHYDNTGDDAGEFIEVVGGGRAARGEVHGFYSCIRQWLSGSSSTGPGFRSARPA